jgi:hypothetical protein
MFGAACLGFVLTLGLQALGSTDAKGLEAFAQAFLLLIAAWIAVWMLASVLGYAIPVLHAAQLARAAEQWRRDKAPMSPR